MSSAKSKIADSNQPDDQHFWQGRIQRKLHHFPAKIRQLSSVVQGTFNEEDIKALIEWKLC